MKDINVKEIFALKAHAHHLNPVVIIGQQGLTDAIVSETNCHLQAHGLIKVQVTTLDRDERNEVARALCAATGAVLVQHIGKQLVLFRAKEIAKKPAKTTKSTKLLKHA